MTDTTKTLRVTLKVAPAYQVWVGAKDLGYFRETAEMAGMKCLQNDKGETLVVDAGGPFESALLGAFGNDVQVIKASLTLFNKITEATPAAEQKS